MASKNDCANFCRPDEIVMASKDRGHLEKLADVATLSHKYQLGTFQSWSVQSILAQCERRTGSSSCPYLKICPSHLLPVLLRLSVLLDEVDFRNCIISAWVARLTASSSSLFLCHLPTSAFPSALLSAEENQLRGFSGQLYYARLTISPRASSQSVLQRTELPFQELEPKHISRILRGSWLLSHAWQNLITSIPELPRATKCQHHNSKCVPQWRMLWGTGSTKGEAPDIRSKLNWIKNYLILEDSDPFEVIHASCARKAQGVVESLITQLEQALPDYFLGPPQ
ncbi:hypothetical protein C8R45DRAFT_388282 [Mycena sanguinolenta]|nr:hypothetical protein C8R45DRAFT_388282 [Mycena sanguinolenta]